MSQASKTSKVPVKETRRTPRRVFTRPIGVLSEGKYGMAQALQLSEGGMLFRSLKTHIVGRRVIVTILLPGGFNVVARSEVIYEKPMPNGGVAYGLKFLGLPLHLRRIVRNYVTAKTQEEAEREADELDDEFMSRH